MTIEELAAPNPGETIIGGWGEGQNAPTICCVCGSKELVKVEQLPGVLFFGLCEEHKDKSVQFVPVSLAVIEIKIC